MSSPYKKVKLANQGWVGFTNIGKLEPNKAYMMLGIIETNHVQYGPGQQATILAHDGKKWRTQLPGKYLAQLTQEDINTMKKDIMDKKNIFLVYREKMIDNSYRIDITENDSWVVNFKQHTDVPELEVSIEEEKVDDGMNKSTLATDEDKDGSADKSTSATEENDGKTDNSASATGGKNGHASEQSST